MAVYCGACGTRLDGAWENGGSFHVSDKFKNGWDTDERSDSPRIKDTCESCSKTLADAVAAAATTIAAKSQRTIVKLKANVEAAREQRARDTKDRAAFEEEWQTRRRRRPT